jgi:hypothetical protein
MTTGLVNQAITDGSLALALEVHAAVPGRYLVDGILYTAEGIPLAWARAARELEEGVHVLELVYTADVLGRIAGTASELRYALLAPPPSPEICGRQPLRAAVSPVRAAAR